MKKYLNIFKFALKEQLQYKWNFIVSIILMTINSAIFMIIFMLFINFFKEVDLTMWDFILVFGIFSFYFAILHWLFAWIAQISNIIETWKLDYYLSFPLKVLPFITFSKVDPVNIWDLLISIILWIIYNINYTSDPVFLLKYFVIAIIWSLAFIGIFIFVSSISFWLDKWSELRDLFHQVFTVFWAYPPPIYWQNKIIFIILAVLGLFPLTILPYYIITQPSWWIQWWLFVFISIWLLALWILIFNRWLKRYKSWNLVLQH